MKKKIIISLFSFFSITAISQNWVQVGLGAYSCGYGVQKLYADPVNNLLYAGGNFRTTGSDTIKGIARWNGVKWDSLGSGLKYPGKALGIAYYNGELYVAGNFTKVGGIQTNAIAKWNGTTWSAVPPGIGTVVFDLYIYNNQLFVGGMFAPIDTTISKAIVRRIGNGWYSVGNPQWSITKIKTIQNYNGEIYAAGSFEADSRNILRWNGNVWQTVGNGIIGNGSIDVPINKMIVYQNKLYIAGNFITQDGNAGNNIVSWDGNTFSDVGGGTGQIFDMTVYNNKLYVVGNFSNAGGIVANNIAYWDGTNWCGLGSSFNGYINAIEVFNNELYVGGGFSSIDGNSVNYVAKWTGGAFISACGNNAIGIPEIGLQQNEITIYPNPIGNVLNISDKQNQLEKSTIEISNTLGQLIFKTNYLKSIDVSKLSQGVYAIKITTSGSKMYNSKLIKE
ncbi:MAG: T9SS type A sorting domain-containing protein [Bacteroidetes bacterium]|nr:T9SS type A sorting domain-containing protein [Bacteroidota bacterium]